MSQTVEACNICAHPMQVRVVATNMPGTRPVEMAMCRLCDVRRCSRCNHYCQDPTTKRCPKCRADFRDIAA